MGQSDDMSVEDPTGSGRANKASWVQSGQVLSEGRTDQARPADSQRRFTSQCGGSEAAWRLASTGAHWRCSYVMPFVAREAVGKQANAVGSGWQCPSVGPGRGCRLHRPCLVDRRILTSAGAIGNSVTAPFGAVSSARVARRRRPTASQSGGGVPWLAAARALARCDFPDKEAPSSWRVQGQALIAAWLQQASAQRRSWAGSIGSDPTQRSITYSGGWRGIACRMDRIAAAEEMRTRGHIKH